MKSHLKVKVYSLMTEMTYIRRQEEKWKTHARIARQRQKENSVKYAESNFWSRRLKNFIGRGTANILWQANLEYPNRLFQLLFATSGGHNAFQEI